MDIIVETYLKYAICYLLINVISVIFTVHLL